MLSRVADNLYWFGRYLQRAENTARIVNVHGHLIFDLPRQVEFGWLPLVQILGAEEEYRERYPDVSEANIMRFLLLDEQNSGSILSSLHHAREILRTIRECMPREIWERLNDLHYLLVEKGEKSLTSRSKRQDFLTQMIDGALLIYGMLTANMSQDVGFQFLRLGTNLEQADMTTRIIDVRSSSLIKSASGDLAPFQNIQWMGVLRSLMGYQMFRRHIRGRVNGPNVLRFLLQNREFPRSVTYCLNMIATTLPKLPPDRRPQRSVERLRALVMDANIDRLMEGGLSEVMDEIQVGIAQVHEAVSTAYFKV